MRKLAIAVLLTAPGCATIVASGPDTISVNSDPEGAKVLLDGAPVGRTPCQVSVKRDAEAVFTFEAVGYQRAIVDRDKVINGWFVANALWGVVGCPVGVAIDLIAHNQGKYSTDPIFVQLLPVVETTPGPTKP